MAENAKSEGVTQKESSEGVTEQTTSEGATPSGTPTAGTAEHPYHIFNDSDSLVLTVVLEFGAPDAFGLISQFATIKFNTWYMHGNGSCCFLNTFFILS